MNEEKNKKNIVIVLVVLAIVLGYFVYQKSGLNLFSTNKVNDDINKISSGEYTQDEMNLLNVPGPDATQSQIDEHSKLAAKLAFVGNSVELRECKPNHIVLQTKLNSDTKLKNVSEGDIKVSFDGQKFIDILAGKSVNISKEFVHGKGLYGYLCNQKEFTGLVGFVLVAP